VFVEIIEYYIGIRIALDFIDNTYITCRFVAYFGDAFYFLFIDKLDRTFDHVGFIDQIWDFRDHDNFTSRFGRFDFGTSTHDNPSASRFESIPHATMSIDISPSWEIWSFDVLHQLVNFNISVVNIGYSTIDNFGQVVRGHIGGHTHGNTRSSVYQKVRDTARQHRRFFQ